MGIKTFVARKKLQFKASRVRRKIEKADISAIRREESFKQRQETTKFREQERGKRQRAGISSGGVFGEVRKAALSITKPRTVKTPQKFKTTYIKKGKRYVKKRVAIKQQTQIAPAPRPAPRSFNMSDMPKIPI